MKRSTLAVPEMSCEACRTTIEGALAPLAGVERASVDLERKLVTVEHDETLSAVDRLAAAVEEQGYEVADAGTR